MSDYSYVTDPPILADIGEATLLFSNTSFSTKVTSYLHAGLTDENLELTLTDMTLEAVAEPFCKFDGISDFSDVATGTVNTVAAVVRNRVASLINGGDVYGVDAKIQAIINKILALIPGTIKFGDSGLYLDGWLKENLQTSNDALIAKMKLMIRYDNATFDSSQCSNTLHAKFMERLFDIQIAVNDCSVNELIFSLYEAGVLALPVKSKLLTTNLLGLLVGHDIVK